MRVCYLIQCHRAPRQLLRLVATLRRQSPQALILCAADDTGTLPSREELRRAGEAHLLSVRGPLRRGYLSLLEPYLRGVDWLRQRGLDFDWLVYLSGQDYPTLPLARSEAMLEHSACDGYLRSWPAFAADTPWGRPKQGQRRYGFRYRDLPAAAMPLLRLLRGMNGVQSLFHVHLVYGPRLGLRRRVPLAGAGVCYGGWQWTTLRRACAEYVADTPRREPRLFAAYAATICPDESLAQTVLVNSGRFRLVDDNLRFTDSGATRDGHPRLLEASDLPAMTSGAYHFARKFDLDLRPELLDRLDEKLAAS